MEVLEKGHADPEKVLGDFTHETNLGFKLAHLAGAQAYEEATGVYQTRSVIEAFVAGHLGGEEEMAVPIILHHRLRG